MKRIYWFQTCACLLPFVLAGFILIRQIARHTAELGLDTVHAQNAPQWWLIWTDTTHPNELYRPRLYKVQDGGCSIYVLVAGSGGDDGDHVSVSTGAGCK